MGNNLKKLREARRWTHDDAAKAMGVSRGGFIKLERGERKLTEDTIERAAGAFGVPKAAILADDLDPRALAPRPDDAFKVTPERVIPAADLVGARDLPVYAAAEGGKGHLIISTDAVEYVKRPYMLEGVPGAYAVLVYGDSMKNEFEHGDMALVHPGRPYQRDVTCIFYDETEGQAEAMIKRLVSWTDSHWTVEQSNPPKKWKVDRADWPKVHVTVGKFGRRG